MTGCIRFLLGFFHVHCSSHDYPAGWAGIAYGVGEVAAVPYERHDQPLDAVVTERETILFAGQ